MRCLLALPIFLSMGACAGLSQPSSSRPDAGIPKALAAQERFSTLLELLRASGLDRELASGGPYTLFAPTNEAFAALDEGTLQRGLEDDNRERLRAVLRSHVSSDRLMKSALQTMQTVETLEGYELRVQSVGDRLLIGEAVVADSNIVADNGIIHAIDAVLPPPAKYFKDTEPSKTTGRKGGPDAWWW